MTNSTILAMDSKAKFGPRTAHLPSCVLNYGRGWRWGSKFLGLLSMLHFSHMGRPHPSSVDGWVLAKQVSNPGPFVERKTDASSERSQHKS